MTGKITKQDIYRAIDIEEAEWAVESTRAELVARERYLSLLKSGASEDELDIAMQEIEDIIE